MKKYSIDKDFKFVSLLTLTHFVMRALHTQISLNSNVEVELYNTTATMHGFDMAGKSKIVIKSIGRRTDFLRECFK